MSEINEAKVACLCGAVGISAKQASSNVCACHCGMCRQWGGGPLMVVACGTDVAFTGEENLAVFDSSTWGQRGFCRQCGSHLFYKLKSSGDYMVPAGLFGTGSSLVFDCQVFTDEKPGFYCFADKTKEMTGAELLAQFSPPSAE